MAIKKRPTKRTHNQQTVAAPQVNKEGTNKCATKSVPSELIASRAYELWQLRGGTHGSDQQDWFRAERDLLKSL